MVSLLFTFKLSLFTINEKSRKLPLFFYLIIIFFLLMSIASDHSQLQRQLYLLGYSHTLPEEGVNLVGTLLKDMQAALDRVKELEQINLRLEREERTSRAGGDKYRTELLALRKDNNGLRTELLNHTREVEKIRRESRTQSYQWSKQLDDLKMANLQIKAEGAENLRMLDECQKKLEAKLADQDPVGRVPRIKMTTQQVDTSRFQRPANQLPEPQPAIIDLVDLSTRRIHALEEEVSTLDSKIQATTAELKATQMEVKERDLEIMRLQTECDKMGGGSHTDNGTDQVTRLNDQIDYLHERAETLEREAKENSEQFAREKEELRRRLMGAENERVRLSDDVDDAPLPDEWRQPLQRIRELAVQLAQTSSTNRERVKAIQDQLNGELQRMQTTDTPVGDNNNSSMDLERLRAECANIKSLYSQTRDQLQELLKSGNTEAKQSQEQAKKTEEALQTKLDTLTSQLNKMPDYKELAKTRQQQIERLEKEVSAIHRDQNETLAAQAKEATQLSKKLKQAQAALEQSQKSASSRQSQYDGTLAEYQQLIEQHKKLDRSLKQAVSEVSQWRSKVSDREHRLGEVSRRLDEYRLAHKQTGAELRACRKTLESYNNDLATLRDAHDNDQREVERAREELQQAIRLKRAIEMAKDDYKRQLAKALRENDSHRSLVSHLQAERSALRVQVKAQFHLSQRLEQRLESLDSTYIRGVDRDDNQDSLLFSDPSISSLHLQDDRHSLPPVPLKPQRTTSHSSSAAHSSRSFDVGSIRHRHSSTNGEVDEGDSTSSISVP